MSTLNQDMVNILDYLRQRRGFDWSGYCPAVLTRRLQERLTAVLARSNSEYLLWLQSQPQELDALLEALTIKVSSFFRDPLSFHYLREKILPQILARKIGLPHPSLRIWSAACATGEEPYSLAMLVDEALVKEPTVFTVRIFATDIDPGALAKGREATYFAQSIQNVPYGFVEKYFREQAGVFKVKPEIIRRVNFSRMDLLDQQRCAPAESVFGDFDLVTCRNLLIYFQIDYQDLILKKLWQALAVGGYLVLGETETLAPAARKKFRPVSNCCQIYQKQEGDS